MFPETPPPFVTFVTSPPYGGIRRVALSYCSVREGAAAAGGVWEPDARARFGMLHGVSSVFYLVQSLLGVALIWRLR